MSRDTRLRTLLIAIGAVSCLGVIDAATGRTWDLVVLFAIVLVLAAAASIRLWSGRHTITLRGDLARWLAIRAADGGEPVDRIADRAVGAYRAGLIDDRPGS